MHKLKSRKSIKSLDRYRQRSSAPDIRTPNKKRSRSLVQSNDLELTLQAKREGIILSPGELPNRTEFELSKEQDRLATMHLLLQTMFDDFPSNMLQTLLLREEGNAKAVAKSLVYRGWKPRSQYMKSLHETPCKLLQIKYFWGKWKAEYGATLRTQPTGTYVSAFYNKKPVICYVDNDGELIMKRIPFPMIIETQRREMLLSEPLSRPSSIKLPDLVPRLLLPLMVKHKTGTLFQG